MSTAELYDPVLQTFTATGSMRAPRANHTATLLANGTILVAGGNGAKFATLNTTELYDNGTFTATGNLSAARDRHTATLLSNGRVLIAGGYDGAVLNSAEIYDPATASSSATDSAVFVEASKSVDVPPVTSTVLRCHTDVIGSSCRHRDAAATSGSVAMCCGELKRLRPERKDLRPRSRLSPGPSRKTALMRS